MRGTARALILAGTLIVGSPTLMYFLGKWEGEGQNTVYPDTLARGLPTVCKGITKHTSPYPVIVGDYWSEERCEEVEQMVMKTTQLKLSDCITNLAITQAVFDALSSHAHNFGVAATCASRAVGLINSGNIPAGCHALAWSPSGKPVWAFITQPDGSKRFVQGLHNRRLDERKLCMSGT